MYPQFEEVSKIEHLQGYLYSQQAVSNTVLFSPGSIYEYSIIELDIEQFSGALKPAIVQLILDRLNGNLRLTAAEVDFLHQKSNLNPILNWEINLQKDLEKWFIDPYLHINVPRNHYEKMVDPSWTTKQKNKFIETGYNHITKTNDRLKEQRPASKYFIYLIQLLLGNKELEVWKYSVTGSSDKRYPRCMDLYWGMEFDLFFIKNKTRILFLHLGNVLT